MSEQAESRLLNAICLIIGTIMLYRGIIDFFLFKDNPWRTLLGLIFFGGVISIFLMYRRRKVGFWMFAFFDFSVGIVFIFFLQDIWYHHVLPHVAYAAVFVPFYGLMSWSAPPDPNDARVPPEPRRKLLSYLSDPLISLVQRWPVIARVIERIPLIQRAINRLIINGVTSAPPPRPHPFSLWTPGKRAIPRADGRVPTHSTFTAWPSLVDRSFTGRHLPPISAAHVEALPPIDGVSRLFERRAFTPSGKTTVLFCFFAQWFTDSFLRTSPDDARKNTSNHDIDLCQIYGLGQESTRMLRSLHAGHLKSRRGEPLVPDGSHPIYPQRLVDPETLEVKKEFADIAFDPIQATSFDRRDPPHGCAANLRKILKDIGDWTQTDDRWIRHYAAGLERANSTLLYSAVSTVFLRNHNRLADGLAAEYEDRASQDDGDDWLFETARNINIVQLLKIIVEDYINHLAGSPFKLRLEQGFADRCRWYRANRISLEFNLLYRWHAMVPDSFKLDGRTLTDREFRFNNALLEEVGVEAVIDAAASQAAGRLQLGNTPGFLQQPEVRSIAFARQFRLAGFNAYRRRWQLPSYESIDQLAKGDDVLIAELKALYEDLPATPDSPAVPAIERVELPVGLLVEARGRDQVLPDLLRRMVASDALSQALTNPLLANYVYGVDCFTAYGVDEIERLDGFADLVRLNRTPGTPSVAATFSAPEFSSSSRAA
ncbi:MAG TPA: peroxidase family protein [Allosphingosinicella sp.]